MVGIKQVSLKKAKFRLVTLFYFFLLIFYLFSDFVLIQAIVLTPHPLIFKNYPPPFEDLKRKKVNCKEYKVKRQTFKSIYNNYFSEYFLKEKIIPKQIPVFILAFLGALLINIHLIFKSNLALDISKTILAGLKEN